MTQMIGNLGSWLGDIGPRLVAALTFLPCGLLMGYTMASFALDRKNLTEIIYYGPLILGILSALLVAVGICAMKFLRGKIQFYHFEIFIVGSILNVVGSIFFFINGLDNIGAFIAFISYGITFISALTYLNIISAKNNRAIVLSSCFLWYLIGLSTALSLIGNSYKNAKSKTDESLSNSKPTTILEKFDNISSLTESIGYEKENPPESSSDLYGIYQSFGGIYLASALLIGTALILIKVFNYLGNLDYKRSLDHEIFIANSNETIFDNRVEVIKRVHFFYITKSKQWLVSSILLFCDAIHFSLFIYLTFWFSLNPAIQLTKGYNFGLVFWAVFGGALVGIIGLTFCSIKIIFVTSTLAQIACIFLGMFIRKTTLIPLWIVCFLYGMNFSNIKVLILETSHLKYGELLVFLSCAAKLAAVGVINVSFIRDSSNSIFYRDDLATLIAHTLAFVTISALITIIVTIKVPRTYKNSLFDIQYSLLGIIFKQHQIEQLNMKYLSDGTIPTISRTVDT